MSAALRTRVTARGGRAHITNSTSTASSNNATKQPAAMFCYSICLSNSCGIQHKGGAAFRRKVVAALDYKTISVLPSQKIYIF